VHGTSAFLSSVDGFHIIVDGIKIRARTEKHFPAQYLAPRRQVAGQIPSEVASFLAWMAK